MKWTIAAMLVLGLGLLAPPCPAFPCTLCVSVVNQQTLRQEIEQARLVIYGTPANPRFTPDGAAGSGVTDFHIAKVLKSDPFLGDSKVIQLSRYIPVLDPKQPPILIIFCNVVNGELDAYRGKTVKSPAVLNYLEEAKTLLGKDRTTALLFYFRHLDHADETIAADAFLEFARASDQEIAQVACRLQPEQMRKLVQDPKMPPERLSLYAFLLGGCGGARDAELLRAMIDQPEERTANALDGLLSGYIHLQPRAGWDLAVAILADRRKPFSQRLAVSRTLRFYHACKPAETKQEVLRGLGVMVEDGDLADLAVEDLRRWQVWDLTGKVLAQYGKKSHETPIVRRAIARYALSCPLAEATLFAQNLRRQDPELVRELEEALNFEKQR